MMTFSVPGAGFPGAQSTLNIMLTEGHFNRNLPLGKIVELTSTNPAKLFGSLSHKGIIAVDSDADLAIVNLNKSFELKKEDLFYCHQQCFMFSRTFKGQVYNNDCQWGYCF